MQILEFLIHRTKIIHLDSNQVLFPRGTDSIPSEQGHSRRRFYASTWPAPPPFESPRPPPSSSIFDR
ncbi:hypothetical protein PDE_06905 [Penicillium oxalicum 114-2]|uniref:Uncharacterized protein n=1 Tax=Penicillium oxalicum (strain 114-2 / CGMCC 5302) TaxID=933388 RepID=S7ZT79_PENO1|nr:hypothetical protein PDE_06905 [Penicillium oxalicum 114-2]